MTLLAGAYPAFVLASFRPSIVTKARATGRLQSGVRQGLVALQFAIVIAVLIATIVVHRQTAFGMRESLRLASDPTMYVVTNCNDAMKDEMARVPGVKAAACSSNVFMAGTAGVGPVNYNGSDRLILGNVNVDIGLFELLGIELAAGRYFSDDFGADKTPEGAKWTVPESIILNEAGVAKLGIASPQAAMGQMVTLNHPSAAVGTFSGEHTAQIIGVVKNFQQGSVRNDYYPTVFFVDPGMFRLVNLKLDRSKVPETVDAIDRIARAMGPPGPPQRQFLDDTVQRIYGDLRRDFELFTVFASVAILISALGLVGLAAHAASARTKEIGVRKVLGSGRAGIMGLLMWQFSLPVLLANLIAWPAAYLAMSSWLAGFARRIEPRAVDVRRGRARDASGCRAHGRRARVGDRGRAAGGGATARVKGAPLLLDRAGQRFREDLARLGRLLIHDEQPYASGAAFERDVETDDRCLDALRAERDPREVGFDARIERSDRRHDSELSSIRPPPRVRLKRASTRRSR